MAEKNIRVAVALYRKTFEKAGVKKKEFPGDRHPIVRNEALGHAYFMLDIVEELLGQGEVAKAEAKLEFVKGLLWDKKFFTLDELESHAAS